MASRENAGDYGTAANGRRTDIGQRDLPVGEQAEDTWVAGSGATEIMGLSMRRTDRQDGGKKQQKDQQTSEG